MNQRISYALVVVGALGLGATLWSYGIHFRLMIASFVATGYVGFRSASNRPFGMAVLAALGIWAVTVVQLNFRYAAQSVEVPFVLSGLLLGAIAIGRLSRPTWSRDQLVGVCLGVALIGIGVALAVAKVVAGGEFVGLALASAGATIITGSVRKR